MKKIMYLLFLLTGTASYAQNWQLGGNNPPVLNSTNNTLGTNNLLPIRFETNNNERMRLTETGLLGLNTTTPQAMLHINGNFGQANSIGEVFRTTTRSTVSTYWRMFRGPIEQAAIYNLADRTLRFQTMQDRGSLMFHISHFDAKLATFFV